MAGKRWLADPNAPWLDMAHLSTSVIKIRFYLKFHSALPRILFNVRLGLDQSRHADGQQTLNGVR